MVCLLFSVALSAWNCKCYTANAALWTPQRILTIFARSIIGNTSKVRTGVTCTSYPIYYYEMSVQKHHWLTWRLRSWKLVSRAAWLCKDKPLIRYTRFSFSHLEP